MNDENLDIILSYEALNKAWNKIKAKKAQYGIDNVTIEQFQENYRKNVDELITQVKIGKYIPEPYKLIFIEKKNGEYRPISMLSIKDKLLQTVFANFYGEKINKLFSDANYAYRPNKGHVKAIKRVRDYIARKYFWFAHLDIDNFFNNIDRKILYEKLKQYVFNETALNIFRMWIETGVIHKGRYKSGSKGIAQGGVVSPLLSNIYLNDFDKMLAENNIAFVRYSDNILIISKTEEEIKKYFELAVNYLRKNLELGINKKEKYIKNYKDGIEFLGIRFAGGKLTMAPEKLEEKLEKITRLVKNNSVETIPEKLFLTLQGIKNYYLHFDTAEQLLEIAEHIAKEITYKAISEQFPKRKLVRIFYNLNLSFVTPLIKNTHYVKIMYELYGKDAEYAEQTGKIRRKIEIKSRKYVKELFDSLNMIISTSYSSIGKRRNALIVRNKGKILYETAVNKVGNIIVAAKGVTISSNAVELASKAKINIYYMDGLGKTYAVIIPGQAPLNKAAIEQLKTLNNKNAQIVAKKIILAKIKNQLNTLKYFRKSSVSRVPAEIWEAETAALKKSIEQIKILEFEEDIDVFRNKLLGYEGNFATGYWRIFSFIVPEFYGFTAREHKGAKDPVNILLNYGYGVLYGRILTSVTAAGLNPQIGFLHKPQKNKPALVFDLIEPFRAPVIDRTVLALLSKMKKIKITPENFSETVKSKYLKKIFERLSSDFYYKKERVNFNSLILRQAQEIKKFVLGEIKTPEIFVAKW